MRKLLSVGVVVAAVLAVVTPVLTNVGAQAANPTTVVLSFDEGWANQSTAVSLLDAHGMKGTFYVNSENVDQPGWLTWNQLVAMQTDGQEIGGAALTQQDLAAAEAASAGAAQASICQDRARIVNHGLTSVTDFAYPYGVGYETPAVHDAVSACGYNSARRQWGIVEDGLHAASLTDLYAIETAPQPTSATTAATLEASVTDALTHSGGVVPFVFHQICSGAGCEDPSTSPATLNTFLNWLQTKSGVTVKTMAQVVGGSVQATPALDDTTAPASTVACDTIACSPSYAEGISTSISFAATDAGSGVDSIFYTTDGTTPTITSPVYTAPFPITYNTTLEYFAWDNAGNIEPVNTATITIPDTIAPTSTILCNGTDCDNGYFNPQSPITLAGVDNGSGIKQIRYTTDGTTPTASHGTIYAAPFTVPTTTTVKYVAIDNANLVESVVNSQQIRVDTGVPTATATCNGGACSTGWYHGPVKIAMAASGAGVSGLAGVYYTLDNSTPTTASHLYTGPFTLSASKTVKFAAIGNAGNSGTVKAKAVQIDLVKPAITFNPGNGKKVTGAVKITVTAADHNSGVARIKFAIDGHQIKVVLGGKLTATWHTGSVAKGRHTFAATAIDKAGNTVTKTVHVTVK